MTSDTTDMTSSNDTYGLLAPLLPSHSYALAYALPLFFISVLLAFAGAFLTLDRTRSFPLTAAPQSAQKSKRVCSDSLIPSKWSAVLEGGVGGLASGYSFGVHLSTFLALLIPNNASSGPLSRQSFTAIWILSAIPCTLLAGRWKYVAIIFSAVTGFATIALALAVIAHPALLTRIVLMAVFTPLGMILCLLPFPKLSRVSLRLACAATGAFGIVLSIAIMSRVSAWANVWERLWVEDGDDWGTSKERGLSAAYCLLLTTGLVSDWFLHLKFGENPDEKWDRYLADYSANLPNDRRAGAFTPLVSIWDRVFGQHRAFAPVVPDTTFHRDHNRKLPPASSTVYTLSKQRTFPSTESISELLYSKPRSNPLRKKGSVRVAGMKRTRRAIKFQPLDEEASSSSDEETFIDDKPLRRSRSIRTDSSATLTNSRTERRSMQDLELGLKPPKISWDTKGRDIPDYSDYEEDITSVGKQQQGRDTPGWTPEFIRRHSQRTSPGPGPAANAVPPNKPIRSETLPEYPDGMPVASVPATPSLIRAVDRIAAAQEALYGSAAPPASMPAASASAAPIPESREQRHHAWNSFWTDVKAKAKS